MNILGVGGPELIIILVMMLVIAGPKRMVKWAYVMGQYVARFRRMWAETVDVLQKEFDDAGVEFQIPRDMPTRGSLNKEASKLLGTVTDPVKETLDQVNTEVGGIRKTTALSAKAATAVTAGGNGHAKRPATSATSRKPAAGSQSDGFGSWSKHDSKPDFGSWTGNGQSQDEEE